MKRSKATIANALLWAALMIALSVLFGDHPNASTIVLLLIPAWFVSDGLISGQARSDWTCLKRRVTRSR
ncbi:MAG: hypothetical protein R3200_12430 [Xanthomonadales bacterium]|nr:hypothetical protein [Xanthomonadales bacterium]